MLVLCGLGLVFSLTLGFFADSISRQLTETKLAVITTMSERALDQVLDQAEEDRRDKLTALDVAQNPPSALMASFGQLHTEQVAKYGNPDSQPNQGQPIQGIDRNGATAKSIAIQMDRYLVPPLE